jgi:phenylalanyl-tRNA synthetase beta chain
LMSSLGFDELYLYSFIGKDSFDKTLLDSEQSIKLRNPLSPELEYLRTSHVPALLEKVTFNLSNFDEVQAYILGRVYFKEKNEEGLPKQPKYLTSLITTDASPRSLHINLKGKIETLLARLHIEDISFEKTDAISFFHPNLQSQILSKKEYIGNIGLVHPKVKRNWKLKFDTVLCTLFTEKVSELYHEYGRYKKVPKYPSVRRDLSFWIDKKIEAEKVLKNLSQEKGDYIQNISIIDIFSKSKRPDKHSFTIQITLQSQKGTLTEEDITSDLNKLITAVEKLGGKIRGKDEEE